MSTMNAVRNIVLAAAAVAATVAAAAPAGADPDPTPSPGYQIPTPSGGSAFPGVNLSADLRRGTASMRAAL
jgi:hypothetical protein